MLRPLETSLGCVGVGSRPHPQTEPSSYPVALAWDRLRYACPHLLMIPLSASNTSSKVGLQIISTYGAQSK